MAKSEINVEVTDRVLKPVPEVFQAIVDPEKLSKFFVSDARAHSEELIWSGDGA